MTDIFTKPLDSSRFAALRGGFVFDILMTWFEGSWCFILYIYIFFFSLAFSSYSPKSLCFTYYTSLYLFNCAYHYVRMSSNEM
jgi:hypothetical protein